MLNKLGGRIDCDVAILSASTFSFTVGVPVWYIERGRSRPSLEPVTELPRARGIEVAGFGDAAARVLESMSSLRSISDPGNAIDLLVEVGVPGCGMRLWRVGLALLRLEECEVSLLLST